MNKRRLIPLFAAFVLWGSQYVISKIALRTVPPVTLLALRYLVSVPALFIVLRLRHALTPVKKGDWPILFAIGFTGYFASFCLQMLGIDRLTGSLSSLLGAMNPIFIPILAALFLHERITLSKIACVALSMLGVVVIVGVGGTADAMSVLMMLVSVFLWSTASIIIRPSAAGPDADRAGCDLLRPCLTGAWSLIELKAPPAPFRCKASSPCCIWAFRYYRRDPFALELQPAE